PIVLAGALFFLAISLGDVGKVLGRIRAIPLLDLAITLGCAFVYLVFKGLQLHLLLADLGAHPKPRRFLLAFAVGELAVTFPLGIFAQNWVLSENDRIRFGRSSAATVVMLVIAALVFSVLRFEPFAQKFADKVRHEKLHKAMDEAIGLIRGLKRLAGW